MVTFSGPNSVFPSQGPKIQFPFQRRTSQLISRAIHGGNQRTIQGSQSPGPAGVGCQGIKYLNTAWTTQLVRTGGNQSSGMYLAQLANSYFTVGIQSHISNFKLARSVLTHFRQYSR
ncbi:hypothetical protein O181_061786 [Austropuccinia psidii MF-1]|uniref:Uncharacterized protein n=1 Tax=Austropuccinia psidii MF-1 TaxID=1389203 RepID=A0A9Q3HXW6_9BASI|nr:hypothetical protein [Austropuccinia psidii MF-1]